MPTTTSYTWPARLEALREAKLAANREKQEMTGCLNGDDLAFILPPPDRRKVVEAVSGSGMKIRDCLLDGITMESNHPNGGFYGPRACGRNFAVLLRNHPPFTDPMSSLAGAYMTNFGSYRRGGVEARARLRPPRARTAEIRDPVRHRRGPALLPGPGHRP